MENKKHLPMMGVGPVYVAVIIAVTVIAVIAENRLASYEALKKLAEKQKEKV